jgi:ATP-dependent DNA helicase HFM1/MER3
VSGQTHLESTLHLNLTEFLNSEIALGTINNLSTAHAWLRGTFLYQRIQKNPSHYGIDNPSGKTWQERLNDLVTESIFRLQEYGIVGKQDDSGLFKSTEYGIVMSKVGL